VLTWGSLSFAAPWVLAALLLLPVIWWLLRLTPPAPFRIRFPPIRILFGLMTKEESAAKTPPWLLALRLALALAVILGSAHPLVNAEPGLDADGPVVVIVDDGWAAAANWPARRALLSAIVQRAERQERTVALVTTAPAEAGGGPPAPQILRPVDARAVVEALKPKPWPTDRKAAVGRLTGPAGLALAKSGQVTWLTDGLDAGEMEALLPDLRRLGATTVVSDPPERLALLLKPPVADGDSLALVAARAHGGSGAIVFVRAIAEDGQPLAREALAFAPGEREARQRLVLPAELRNRLARLEIENQSTAGAVVLVDERWRRRPVGLVPGEGAMVEQPLLSDAYYLERALEPFTEIRRGPIASLFARELAVAILADPGHIDDPVRRSLEAWIGNGGVLVRFAGPKLAESLHAGGGEADTHLLPVRLRPGDRVMGGTLSWNRPLPLAAFEEGSPFHGLAVPADVRVRRQVLAQPSPELADRTWAKLADGTPLVTAERRGKGWLVLVHVTANTQWSNLPLSGLFVEMLQRLVALSQGVVAKPGGPPLEPLDVLDGYGRLQGAAVGALAIPAAAFEATRASPAHPPGYYGERSARRALNLSAGIAELKLIGSLPSGVAAATYGVTRETDLRPWLFGLALLLFLVDLAASFAIRGLLRLRRPAAAALLAVAAVLPAPAAFAQARPPAGAAERGGDSFALAASLETNLAYVITGDRQVDEVSRAGLWGLSVILRRRTAAELGDPVGVDAEVHELAFFPLLYWPLVEGAPPPSPRAAARLNAYLRNGGTILFDTRDQSGGPGIAALRAFARVLDIPPLVPTPPNHVLTRAFYLMQEFPGRFAGGTVWVERAGERVNDGVSPIVAGGNDWAGAWAMDDAQRPLFPAVPGGERQRELAYRFGINLVMYTLTGNYKSDQVHVPEILKRLER
jgi:hypothetical protein